MAKSLEFGDPEALRLALQGTVVDRAIDLAREAVWGSVRSPKTVEFGDPEALRLALQGTVVDRAKDVAREARDRIPQIGVVATTAFVSANLALPTTGSAAAVKKNNNVSAHDAPKYKANTLNTASPTHPELVPDKVGDTIHGNTSSASAHSGVVIRRLFKGDTIWNEDEEVIDRQGGDIMHMLSITKEASRVTSEYQAEHLPVGFKVIIPLNETGVMHQRTSTQKSEAHNEAPEVAGGAQYKPGASTPALSMQPKTGHRTPDNHVSTSMPRLKVTEPTGKSTYTLPKITTLPLPSAVTAPKVVPVAPHSVTHVSTSAPPEAPTIPAITTTTPATPVTIRPPAKTPEAISTVPTIDGRKPQLTTGLRPHTVKRVHHKTHAHGTHSHTHKHHTVHRIPAAPHHKVHQPAQHPKATHHPEHHPAHHHKVHLLAQKAIECSPNTSTGHLFGATTAAKVINYFNICDGYSYVQAAGMAGAMQQESGLDPRKLQGGGDSPNPADAGPGGYGIDQVSPGLKIKTYQGDYSITGPVDTMRVQLEIISAQMKGHSPTGFPDLEAVMKRATSTSTAAALFTEDFEGPLNGGNLPRRQLLAGQALQDYLSLQHARTHSTSTDKHKHAHQLPHKRKHRVKQQLPESANSSPPIVSTSAPAVPAINAPAPVTPAVVAPATAAPAIIAPAPTPPVPVVNNISPTDTTSAAAPTIVGTISQPDTGKRVIENGNGTQVAKALSDAVNSATNKNPVAPSWAISKPENNTSTGNAKILDAARRYSGIYYTWGGAHEDPATYNQACPDPTNPTNNQPTGGPYNQNPSSCSVDCSSLTFKAIDDAYGLDLMGTVSESDGSMAYPQYWKELSSVNLVAPGDVATRPGHVEIVVRYDPTSGYLTTLGAHEPGTPVSNATTKDYYTRYFRYVGPGSS